MHDWKRPFTKLSFEERQELQERLSSHGYYDGKLDGKIGSGSRSAIKAFQQAAGLTPDGIRAWKCCRGCAGASA